MSRSWIDSSWGDLEGRHPVVRAGLTLLIRRPGPDEMKPMCCKSDNGFTATRSDLVCDIGE